MSFPDHDDAAVRVRFRMGIDPAASMCVRGQSRAEVLMDSGPRCGGRRRA
jgi:hypothetical protein